MERGLNTRCLHLEETEGKLEHYGAISYPIYQTQPMSIRRQDRAPDMITADFRIPQGSIWKR